MWTGTLWVKLSFASKSWILHLRLRMTMWFRMTWEDPKSLEPILAINYLTSSVYIRYDVTTRRKYKVELTLRKDFFMSPVTLYKRQKQIVDYISQYIQKNGTSPTLQEIANAMGLSSLATVHEHLEVLSTKGVIRRFDGAVRGIELVDEKFATNTSSIELPLVGYIAAGEPIQAIENPLSSVIVSSDLVSKTKRCFVLQVVGDSMIEDGILNGDQVVIQQQETAQNGDIIVALVDEEFATLKRYYLEKDGRVRLQPANSKMDPIYLTASSLTIQGKVTGIVRKY